MKLLSSCLEAEFYSYVEEFLMLWKEMGAWGDVVVLVGRSRDRFPVVTWDFFRGTPDRTMCPEVDSSYESEYQGFRLG